MNKTVAAAYADLSTADRAVSELQTIGVPPARISVVSHQELEDRAENPTVPTSDKVAVGAAGGAVGGVLASLALATVPGFAWVLAAGPIGSLIVTGVVGGGIGAATGGVVSALSDSGVEPEDAGLYAETLRRGGTVVLLTVAERNERRVMGVLQDHQPIDIDASARRWRADGWTGHNPKAEPFGRDAAAAERRRVTTGRTADVAEQVHLQADREAALEEALAVPSDRPAHVRSYASPIEVDETLTLVDPLVSTPRRRRVEGDGQPHAG